MLNLNSALKILSLDKKYNINNIDNLKIQELKKYYYIAALNYHPDKNIDNDNNLFRIYKSICDKIIFIILNSDIKNIDYYELRNILYDLLIYNLYIPECIYYIIEQIIYKNPNINKYFLENIFKEITIFFKLFNNNYRPIYHLERFILVLIYNLHQ